MEGMTTGLARRNAATVTIPMPVATQVLESMIRHSSVGEHTAEAVSTMTRVIGTAEDQALGSKVGSTHTVRVQELGSDRRAW